MGGQGAVGDSLRGHPAWRRRSLSGQVAHHLDSNVGRSTRPRLDRLREADRLSKPCVGSSRVALLARFARRLAGVALTFDLQKPQSDEDWILDLEIKNATSTKRQSLLRPNRLGMKKRPNELRLYELQDLLKLPGEGDKTQVEARIMTRHSVCGMSLMEATVEPGALLPPHTHANSHQAVYVISGALGFNVGGPDGLTFDAPAGSYVIKPKRIVHSFWNLGSETVKYIELTDNDLFEGFIESRHEGDLFAGPAEMRMDWGQYVDLEMTIFFLAKYGLTKIAQAGYDLADAGVRKEILSNASPEILGALREAFGSEKIDKVLQF